MTKTLPIQIDKGNGAPLVLLHGLGTNHKSWEFVLEHIDYTKHRVITLDLLGFGDAPKPKNVKYTPRDHAEAVMATLDKLGIKKAVFAGHSMGCIVAIEIAATWPDRVASLLLLGAPLYKAARQRHWWHKLLPAEGLYFALFDELKKHPVAVQAGGTLANNLAPLVKGMEITDETWPAFRKSLEHAVMQFDTFRKATKLRVPTLFVNGLLDVFIIRRNIKEIRRANRRYVRVRRTLGSHELTPHQGRLVARIINK
ncbi:alpha/beta hydrolase [Candidatus Saccharibacteria bacterium]|nr:MAG: alpha/beta hydrolase [Candidatus Saccharibacteria bacterium]